MSGASDYGRISEAGSATVSLKTIPAEPAVAAEIGGWLEADPTSMLPAPPFPPQAPPPPPPFAPLGDVPVPTGPPVTMGVPTVLLGESRWMMPPPPPPGGKTPFGVVVSALPCPPSADKVPALSMEVLDARIMIPPAPPPSARWCRLLPALHHLRGWSR
jgi:hypothetical protein